MSELADNLEEAIRFYERGLAFEPDNQDIKTRLANLTNGQR
jgi:hypothetical protein